MKRKREKEGDKERKKEREKKRQAIYDRLFTDEVFANNTMKRLFSYIKGDIFGTECTCWTGSTSDGFHGHFGIEGISIPPYRLLYEYYVSKKRLSSKICIRHVGCKEVTGNCCTLAHLLPGTNYDNFRDRARQANPNYKGPTPAQVLHIFSTGQNPDPETISASQVNSIVHFKTWKRLTLPTKNAAERRKQENLPTEPPQQLFKMKISYICNDPIVPYYLTDSTDGLTQTHQPHSPDRLHSLSPTPPNPNPLQDPKPIATPIDLTKVSL
jgi:hypothetical protein